ncbi:MAG TPA: glycosyltransferase family 4 protein [Cytophagaceae bacterium]|jgi:glycosyltransferase involved in cell wall biosynthesis|nr:glycosyltransferase family 4 protein [Cytophagaceae bacterium]
MQISSWVNSGDFYYRSKKHITKWPLYKFAKEVALELIHFFEGILRVILTWNARNKKVLDGVNLIGFVKGDFGLAEHMRLVTHAINTTGEKFCVNNSGKSGGHSATNNELNKFITKNNPYLVNLFCYNAEQTIAYFKSCYGGIALNKHYNIGYGYWELSIYPHHWKEQNKYLNEIWAPSKYIKEVIEKSTNLPVFHMTIPVDFKNPIGYTRKHFNLPEDRFLYLFTFDMSSFVTRKNPQAVIKAFNQSFPIEKADKVCLIVKINRLKTDTGHSKKVEELRTQISVDPRIIIIDEVLDRPSILGLISVCDTYVSLHRSEGFGLGMAEAMKMGKVVIATDYSGNKDFMNQENSCLVKYKLIKVDKSEFTNVEEGAEWADPDVEHAAYYMRKVYEDKTFSERIGLAAKAYIQQYHSFKTIGENYEKRLAEIMKAKP